MAVAVVWKPATCARPTQICAQSPPANTVGPRRIGFIHSLDCVGRSSRPAAGLRDHPPRCRSGRRQCPGGTTEAEEGEGGDEGSRMRRRKQPVAFSGPAGNAAPPLADAGDLAGHLASGFDVRLVPGARGVRVDGVRRTHEVIALIRSFVIPATNKTGSSVGLNTSIARAECRVLMDIIRQSERKRERERDH